MSNPMVTRALYGALGVTNLIITALILQIGKGVVPFPDGWEWTIPIVVAALNGIALALPRLGGEPIAQQVDTLKAEGVARRDMRVVSTAHLRRLTDG